MVVGTFLFAGLATAFELIPPWLIKVIIDDVIQAGQTELLAWVFLALCAAYVLRNLCGSIRIRLNNGLEQQVVHDLHVQVFSTLQRLSISFYENRPTGEIMSRVLNDTEHMQRIFVDGLEEIITAGLTLIGIMIMLFMLNWKLALLALVPIPFLVVGAALFTKRVHGHYRAIRKGAAELNALLQDMLAGIRETMGFNRQPYEQERFDRKSDRCRQDTLKAMYLWSYYSPGMMLIGSLGGAMVLWFGTTEVLQHHLSVGELVMFISYLALFYVPINQIHSVNHMLQHALAASERVFEVLDLVPEVKDRPEAHVPVARLRGEVAFHRVGFHYRADAPILTDVTISVRAGERVALVGPSGAGKSTTLKLLTRFYDVTEGAVTIDGYDIRDVPLAFLRSQIGLVQQEPFLFNGTVRENILYGDLLAGQDEVEAAAKVARAHDFIMALPDGYDTWIGERGVKLSVGQRQRVSIARVILKDPPIVMFDEATSNIDTETEVKIREALDDLTKGRTTIIIAHRLSTIHGVDRIIVVDHGRVVEEGTHEKLIGHEGVYARLYDAQFQV
jgi:ABC-type multidrug transport system fused ATPase/permease subunit